MKTADVLNRRGERKSGNDRIFFFAALSAFIVLTLSGVLTHEPWRDESQAWLIARDLDLRGLFSQMSYEGTPGLWHLILYPFAKSGAPYFSEAAVHLIIAIAGAAVFLRNAPFGKLTKVLFLFSFFTAYQYAVVARSYVLTGLILFCIASIHQRRMEKPLRYALLLALLANTNVHSFGAALALSGLFAIGILRRRPFRITHFAAGTAIFAGFAAALLQLYPHDDCFTSGLFPFFNPRSLISTAGGAFFLFDIKPFNLIPQIFFTIFIVASGFYFIRKPPVFVFYLGALLWPLYIFTFKYPGNQYHLGLITLFTVTAFWLDATYGDKFKDTESPRIIELGKILFLILNASLALSCVRCASAYADEYSERYSGAEDAAEFIIKNIPDSEIIAAHRGPQTAALLPHLPGRKFWYPETERFGTFIIWNRDYYKGTRISFSEAVSRSKKTFSGKEIIFIFNKPYELNREEGLEQIYAPAARRPMVADEQYWIYRMKSPARKR
jgi:hypothetical protein